MPFSSWINYIGDFAEWVSRRPEVRKKEDALRFGILGAANIAPQALTIPARSHAEVIVVAVAARDKERAEAYAKRHGIPIVHENYDALINDSSIDCIYNPLPNGLHYEWTLKALKAGKHVLLEKPSVSNAEEARSLFRHPVLQSPNAPVLVEASHYRFHPAWHVLLSLFDSKDVEEVDVRGSIPAGIFSGDDIRFQYDLAGGSLTDFGHYTTSAMRGIFQSEPVAVMSATPRPIYKGFDQRCDEAFAATYKFPNGGVGRMSVDLGARGGYWFPWLTSNWPCFWRDMPPWLSVRLREEKHGRQNGLEHFSQRTLVLNNFMGPHIWHRIDIVTTAIWRNSSGEIVEEKKSTKSKKVYTWPDGTGGENRGEDWWSTYRYQLEEFVNRVKGREGSGAWIEWEESIKQMELIDQTYEKAGMLLRPTSKVLED
ncbi:oxidoreductase domain-containing protein [Cucurbitaria berberidis CBS 394.84]|uniref:D-xylose 1-dehydrogenase (NADP(+), D-xylono-1,5-lactone-forming) n=1 Tax=Cucurbitaria berberidis CBS 394.84 TaxID=1168544 RepID=A0A9P4G9M1_9PLEO|nr:oxidoreductase domain-containing protein [Cucurbitaria berberidis CBS 394.84]KAF1841708.1 oxidoreductase domain-containing protein [Cucurbitaria berberidis CBS 394.84]